MSREELESTTPVAPPVVNRQIKPRVQRMAGVYFSRAPYRVASHLNTLIPVGIAMIIVAAVK
jgi:hypothetical protein